MNDEGHGIIWRRLDVPGHEAARVYGDEDGWYLDGAAVFLYEGRPCRLEYLIECDPDWQTVAASIDGWMGDEIVEIEVEVDEERIWRLNGQQISSVNGCSDIDLNFSPITNMLPLQRLQLQPGTSGSATTAWLKFPSLTLERLDQTYTIVDEKTVRYESGGGEFVRELKVDAALMVTDYPGFWVRES